MTVGGYNSSMQGKSFILVLFGITGDLSRKRILPALFELFTKKLLPTDWTVIGFIRKEWGSDEFEKFLTEVVGSVESDVLRSFIKHFVPFEGDINDEVSFSNLAKKISELKGDVQMDTLFHLSLSPLMYEKVVQGLIRSETLDANAKVLIEKPFGVDAAGASSLDRLLHQHLSEDRIFRIDHFLLKGCVGDIAEADFDGDRVSGVHIRFMESVVVGERGAFYEKVGAFLDVGQNHLLQLASVVLLNADGLSSRTEAMGVMSLSERELSRGQYEGYKREKNVAEDSDVETYFKVTLDATLGSGVVVPITLESGKGFDELVSNIEVSFENKPSQVFDMKSKRVDSLQPYARVILDALSGEQSMFVSDAEVMEEWRITEEVLPALRKAPLRVYPKGVKYEDIQI